MTKRLIVPLLALVAGMAGANVSLAAPGDSLLLQRVQQEKNMDLPKKGMSMADVEKKYGTPTTKLAPRGGGSAKQPVINRWEYPNYIVYFENSHVVHAVLNTPAGNNTNPLAAQ